MYSIKCMTRKLEKQYGKDIVSKQDSKPSIVCFRNVAYHIIAKSFKDKEIQKLSGCEQNIQTAAKFIKGHQNSSICIRLLPIEARYQEL